MMRHKIFSVIQMLTVTQFLPVTIMFSLSFIPNSGTIHIKYLVLFGEKNWIATVF